MTDQGKGTDKRHWTYRELPSDGDLCQGDIVPKTPLLATGLNQKHPGHVGAETTHLVILSQSCDLARRGSRSCKTPRILVAPVRPMWGVLIDQIATYQSEVEAFAGICRQSSKRDLRQFLERLLNNNVEEYFYLHPDADVGIVEHSCAHIRLCFGLDVAEYYDHLRENRTVSLTEPFGNKLGWHMGWLYARVGTEDWVPDHSTREEFDDIISTLLTSAYPWIPDAKIYEAKEAFSNLPRSECGLPSSSEEMRQFIEIMPGRSPKDKVLYSIRAVLGRAPVFDDRAIAQMVSGLLRKDPYIRQMSDSKGFCQNIGDYLAQESVLTNNLIIGRITDLLNASEQFSALSDKDAVIERLASQLAKARFFDNSALTNKLCNLISGDPEFKDAMKESDS